MMCLCLMMVEKGGGIHSKCERRHRERSMFSYCLYGECFFVGYFFAHPRIVSPTGAISPTGVISRTITLYLFAYKRRGGVGS